MKNTIKVQRAILDITQEDLAGKIGVSRQTINSIEASIASIIAAAANFAGT